MDFILLKQATETINEREQSAHASSMLALNLPAFQQFEKLVCETAEEFLMQIFAKSDNNGTFTPEDVARMAPIAAALQLLASSDTRGTVLGKFRGDQNKNLITLSNSVVKASSPPGGIDKVLMQIGNANARTLTDKISATLSDPQSPSRKEMMADIQKLALWFRQYTAQLQNQPQQQQQTPAPATGTPPPAQGQTATQGTTPAAPGATGNPAPAA